MDKIIAVASGKGGVGKSTVAVNLAVALSQQQVNGRALKVALVDVDFYGPSIPTLMGGGEITPDHQGKILPAMRHSVKYISIAFFLKQPDDPVVWRGPMFGKAISQLFGDVAWGEVDVCVIDLPPGTGDAQISLSQLVKLDGVVMVTTPQEVALSDVRRAINMFRKVNVEILGVVENMAGFVTPDGKSFDIFGKGGGEALAKGYGLNLLASLPIDMSVREGGDIGMPVALNATSAVGKQYAGLAEKIWSTLESRSQPQLQIVN